MKSVLAFISGWSIAGFIFISDPGTPIIAGCVALIAAAGWIYVDATSKEEA